MREEKRGHVRRKKKKGTGSRQMRAKVRQGKRSTARKQERQREDMPDRKDIHAQLHTTDLVKKLSI